VAPSADSVVPKVITSVRPAAILVVAFAKIAEWSARLFATYELPAGTGLGEIEALAEKLAD